MQKMIAGTITHQERFHNGHCPYCDSPDIRCRYSVDSETKKELSLCHCEDCRRVWYADETSRVRLFVENL